MRQSFSLLWLLLAASSVLIQQPFAVHASGKAQTAAPDAPGGGTSNTATATVSAANATPVPVINAGGIVNGTSFTLTSASLAPGSIAAIFGSNLSDGSVCVPPNCGPTFDGNGKAIPTMAGAQVTMNGIAAPILSTPSSSQLNVQIPMELAGAPSAAVLVTVNGQNSVVSSVSLKPLSPGLISVDSSGAGQGAILNDKDANRGVQSLAAAEGRAPNSHTAAPGDVIEIYATGLGAVSPAVATGARPAGLSQTVTTPTVTIGGVPATVVFSGLASCCIGLNQVNVLVPPAAPGGMAVPVALNIGGVQSNTVTIAVSGASSPPAIASLSSSSLAPLSLLTITGSGFDSSAVVNFSSASSGFSVNVQPSVDSQTSITVSVPSVFGGTDFVSGTATVSVVQPSGQSSGFQVQIGKVLSASSLAPGTVTLGFLQGILALATQLSTDAAAGASAADLKSLVSALNGIIQPIQSVYSGSAASVNLGSMNGQPVVLRSADLAQSDRLLMTVLQALGSISGNAGAARISSLNPLGRLISVLPYSSSAGGCSTPGADANALFQVINNGTVSVGAISGQIQNIAPSSIGYDPAAVEKSLKTLVLASDAIIASAAAAEAAGILLPAAVTTAVTAATAIVGVSTVYEFYSLFKHPPDATSASSAVNIFSNALNVSRLLMKTLGALPPLLDLQAALVGAGTDAMKLLESEPPTAPPLPGAACLSATALNFGTVGITSSSSQPPVTLTNIGSGNLAINSITGGTTGDFSQSNSCPTVLAPNQSCTITATFAPRTPGDQNGAILISGNAPGLPQSIYLSGTGKLTVPPFDGSYTGNKLGTENCSGAVDSGPWSFAFQVTNSQISVTDDAGDQPTSISKGTIASDGSTPGFAASFTWGQVSFTGRFGLTGTGGATASGSWTETGSCSGSGTWTATRQ